MGKPIMHDFPDQEYCKPGDGMVDDPIFKGTVGDMIEKLDDTMDAYGTAWCFQPFCYVKDPKACQVWQCENLGYTDVTFTSYFAKLAESGVNLFYSYGNCGGKDFFTSSAFDVLAGKKHSPMCEDVLNPGHSVNSQCKSPIKYYDPEGLEKICNKNADTFDHDACHKECNPVDVLFPPATACASECIQGMDDKYRAACSSF